MVGDLQNMNYGNARLGSKASWGIRTVAYLKHCVGAYKIFIMQCRLYYTINIMNIVIYLFHTCIKNFLK